MPRTAADIRSSAHIAAVTDDGKLYVFDLWESAEAFGAFADSQLAPHAEKMGEVAADVRSRCTT